VRAAAEAGLSVQKGKAGTTAAAAAQSAALDAVNSPAGLQQVDAQEQQQQGGSTHHADDSSCQPMPDLMAEGEDAPPAVLHATTQEPETGVPFGGLG
jgi:hypothetical protein